MHCLTITELEPRHLAEAWPLVRSVAPRATLERWESFARGLLDRGGGVVAVTAENGGILGLATYEAADKLRLGKVLQVETLVAFELTRRAPVRRALCDALDRLAPVLGCAAVAVMVPSRGYLAYVTGKVQCVLEELRLGSSLAVRAR